MDPEVTALPTGDTAAAGEQSTTDAAAAQPNEQQQATGAEQEGAQNEAADGEGDKPAKKEKTAEQREIERLRRRVDNTTRHKHMLEAELQQLRGSRQSPQQQGTEEGDGDTVTLTRAELDRQIAERAKQLAPAVREQEAEIERRQGVIAALSKQWGKEEFDAKASELDDAFGGLVDRSGKPKPATDAIFDADDPKAVIEYLTDPDNAEEAERIARMQPTQAGRAIAKLELKLAEAKKNAKPQPSRAARPIESVKGGGVPNGMPDPSNTKAWVRWANEQERSARR